MNRLVSLFYRLFLQPRALFAWAALILFIHLGARLLGWREMTTVLSGTFPPGANPSVAAACALFYMLTHFAAVLLAPILIIAACIRMLIPKSA